MHTGNGYWGFAMQPGARGAARTCLAVGGADETPGAGEGMRPVSTTGMPPLRAGVRLVVGLGKTGESIVRHLAREKLPVAATDSRREPPAAGLVAGVPHHFGRFESPLPCTELAEAVVSPGVSPREPFLRELQSRGVPVVSDIELFARAVTRPVVAITGTNGKSTVALLVTAMAKAAGLRVAAGGNLGTPALDLLVTDAELFVLELSSFQLERTHRLEPQAAVVLNLSPDHLDWHESMEAYTASKARVYDYAVRAVTNRDDPLVRRMTAVRPEAVSFGLDAPSGEQYGLREKEDGTWLCRGETDLMVAREVPLAGRHNLANVLAAWALGAAVGLDDAAMARAVRGFEPLPHRLTPIVTRAGVRYLDDSKATNVSAACAALGGLAAPSVVIAGGA
ncbi:MAG: UDP-N-acetylmuramoyl-L-alanine--D-glutamate ligase, partial [Gammaproteobacteria bacterium]|nr:UDP-N-acetylmuramoyl-L-alanine--D-glutamate ligase [Gammaproteobacteria bacterium]